MTRSHGYPRILAALAALAAFLALPRTARADNEYVNYMRSSATTYIFVQEAVEGEYGRHKATMSPGAATGASLAGPQSSDADPAQTLTAAGKGQWWQGVGFDTSIGLEVVKFFQLVAGFAPGRPQPGPEVSMGDPHPVHPPKTPPSEYTGDLIRGRF